MKILIGNDHAGYSLKLSIIKNLEDKYEFFDKGSYSDESVDYPDYASIIAKEIQSEKGDLGIIICGTGNGVCMTANKFKGIRAVICWNEEIAKLAKQHNNANIICIPSRFIKVEEAMKIIESFILEKFEGGRHERRIKKINENLY
jgi:ribose 5-phosphate isomerase B|tara:strand:- start:515 stop:949 length:435 start_codon:yes stop_codon:yes gene_type:complete